MTIAIKHQTDKTGIPAFPSQSLSFSDYQYIDSRKAFLKKLMAAKNKSLSAAPDGFRMIGSSGNGRTQNLYPNPFLKVLQNSTLRKMKESVPNQK